MLNIFCVWPARHIRFELIDLARKHLGPLGLDRRHETGVLQADNDQRMEAASGWQPVAPGHDPQMLAQWTEIHEAIERLPESERQVCDLFLVSGVAAERDRRGRWE